MTEQDREYMRYMAAMLAMNGLIQAKVDMAAVAKLAVNQADELIEALEPTIGLPFIKRRAKKGDL